jgi:hypothetical protein
MTHDPDCACFGCHVRSVQVAKPREKRNSIPPKGTAMNSWEKGIVRDSRNMPLLHPGSLEPIPIKRFVERRHEIEEGRRRMAQDPHPA